MTQRNGQQHPKILRILTSTIIIPLVVLLIGTVEARQYSKCEFAEEIRRHFPDEEIAAWTCIAQYESEFKTDAINPTNSDGSSDHGIFQINDRYWCGNQTGKNVCKVECDVLRGEDITASVRCAQIVKDKQGFTAWAVWPKCKGHLVSYLDDCDRSILRLAPPTVFDIQVRPANRGPGFNLTRVTSSLKSFPSKDVRGPAYTLGFNDTRGFNLTSFGAMGFLGGPQSGNYSISGHPNYLANLPIQDTVNISSVIEEPLDIVARPRYQSFLTSFGGMNFLGGNNYRPKVHAAPAFVSQPSTLTSFGGMNFLGGTNYRPKPFVAPVNTVPRRPSTLTRFGGMNFLGGVTISGRRAPLAEQSRTYGPGILRQAGLMGFLGGVTLRPNSFSFRPGSDLSGPAVTAQVQPTRGPVRSRPLGLFGNTGSEAFGPGFLGQQGAMNFLGGVQGIPFSSSKPPVRPLQHLTEGSLLRQIPSKPASSNTFIYRPAREEATISSPQTFIVDSPPPNNVQVSDYLINFQGTGSTIRFGLPGQTFTSNLSPNVPRQRPQAALRTRNKNRVPVLPPATPKPIVQISRPLIPVIAPVRSRTTLSPGRRPFLDYKPQPLNVQTFQQPRTSRPLSPTTSLAISQPNGPAMSYSTGTTYFSIGSSSFSSPSSNVDQSSSLSQPYRAPPIRTRIQAGLSQSTPSLGASQYSSPRTYLYQKPTASFSAVNKQPVYRAPSLRSPPAQTFINHPTIVYNSPSGQRVQSTYKSSLKDHRKRVSYGYQPYLRANSGVSDKSLEDINQQGLQFASQISFTTPTGQFSFGAPLTSVSSGRQSSRIGSFGQSRTVESFSRTVRSPPTSDLDESPKSDSEITSVYAGLPESIRRHMPSGYGGISYMQSSGVMTMVKHYG